MALEHWYTSCLLVELHLFGVYLQSSSSSHLHLFGVYLQRERERERERERVEREVILVSVLETGLPGIAHTAGSDHRFSTYWLSEFWLISDGWLGSISPLGDWANALECWRSPSSRLVIPGIAVSPGVTHSDSHHLWYEQCRKTSTTTTIYKAILVYCHIKPLRSPKYYIMWAETKRSLSSCLFLARGKR